MEAATYSNYLTPDRDPQGLGTNEKGKNSIAVLTLGFNEPKGQESLGGKVTKVVMDSYMRRPSLREEALKKMTEFAHDAICVQQAPGYQAECATGILMTQGDKFRWICTGEIRIFHFVNGQIMETNRGNAARLGSGKTREMPEVLAETDLKQGENSFLICSGSLTQYVKEHEIENALAMSENAEEWLRTLKNLYEDRCQDEPFALMTIFMPQKRKRLPKKAVIAIVIAAVLVLAGVFFALGAARRRNGPGPDRPPMEQGAPGVEPTQPPEPERPPEGQDGGQPGVRPTQPPKPTQPPAPQPPDAPENAEGSQDT